MSLVGVDIGVSGCRVLAIARDGRPLAQAKGSYASERRINGVVLDPGALWEAVRGTVQQVVERTRSDRPRAICVTSSAMAIVPLAAEGGALAPVLLGTTALAQEDSRGGFAGLSADEVVGILGDRPAVVSPLRALAGWRQDEPQLYGRTWRTVPLATWGAIKLGSACAVDLSLAAGMQMLDVAAGEWSSKVLRALGLAESKLPELATASHPIGTVASPVADALGLDRDTLIVLGGADHACAALAVGALQPATGLIALDRVISLLVAFEAPPLVGLLYSHGLNMLPHVVPNRWLTQVITPAGGNVLRWFGEVWAAQEAREAAARGQDFYRNLMEEMPEAPTGLVALPPGEQALLGRSPGRRQGGIWGITDRSSRGEMLKAFLEGAMLACLDSLDALREAGIAPDVLRATGPGARSEPWLQLAADVLGLAIEETGVLHPAPLGAAMTAGIGAGVYSSPRDAVSTVVKVQRRYEPRGKHHQAYCALRKRYQAYAGHLATPDGGP